MAWSTPATAIAGSVLTSAFWNTQVRDNMLDLDTRVNAFSLEDAWPIGSIYTSTVATNPATLLGFGTWAAHGTGRVLVAIDPVQPEFDVVGETGGAKTHTHPAGTLLTPDHQHQPGSLVGPSHTHDVNIDHSHGSLTINASGNTAQGGTGPGTVSADTHTHTGNTNTEGGIKTTTASGTGAVTGLTGMNGASLLTGSTAASSSLMPYEVIYRWKRTA